ncbi:MAG: nucleotidyl transferase AbiEii/AbiGii toxin family protein [Candidatus Ancaeobacter aquaticus]|nr:nucleotidyl transferase AbiEii/AbiGii toxin family protein [Candidatus Ancaeobacter aquaticus]
MNEGLKVMLGKYKCQSINDYENALKEIVQEIALLGLWRSKFFEKSAFYGGSALRILYGLNRFSEDLDFSLLKKDEDFSFGNYCAALEEELRSFGFNTTVEKKEKKIESNIDSAFIKAGTLENLLVVDAVSSLREKIHSKKIIKIKLEVDKNPPGNFQTEAKYLFQPIPFSVNTYTLPCLFAGKMHALLCRSWASRVKGRDWYDLVWYLGMKVPVSIKHLESRMKQTGHLELDESLTEEYLKQMLREKIKTVDFDRAKIDVENLLLDRASLKIWSEGFFQEVCNNINVA